MKRDPQTYLFDMRHAAERVDRFTVGKTFDDYERDELLRAGVERQLGIIGEAAGQLARHFPDLAEHISDFRQIIAFRNILVHDYSRVDDRIVWAKVQQFVPPLAEEVNALLEELSAGDEHSTGPGVH